MYLKSNHLNQQLIVQILHRYHLYVYSKKQSHHSYVRYNNISLFLELKKTSIHVIILESEVFKDKKKGGNEMLKTVAKFEPKQKFNHDIIINQRRNDSMIDYLVDVCKALESISYIKYDDYEVIEEEYKFPNKSNTMPINDSRMYLVIFHFTVTKDGKVEKVNLPLYLPKLIKDYYFILAGTKYYSIYQNIDSATYNTGSCVILKSLLMPIIIRGDKKTFIATNGVGFSGNIFSLNMFKRQINIFNYYFTLGGFDKALKYFGLHDKVQILEKGSVSKKKLQNPESKFLYFLINKEYYLRVSRKDLMNKNFRNYVATLIDVVNKKMEIRKLNNIKYCRTKLGALFTTNTNSQLDKCRTILVSLKRILDERTKKNLHINDKDKKDIFSVVRWITDNYDLLKDLNNFSLENKRLRLSEFMITPFVRYLSGKTYRLLNSKTIDIDKIKGIFRINPMHIISDLQVSDLLRYCNAVNDCDIFNSGLKYSARGPQALGEGSKKTVSIYYRGIHPSHFGRFSLNTCSASDPGLSGCLSPFVKTYGMYYTDKNNLMANDSEKCNVM